MLFIGSGHTRALPLDPLHLKLALVKAINWEHLLALHFKRCVVPGNVASAALAVLCTHNLAEDLLCK